MRNLWKVGALSAVFGAVLGMGGCQDFDAAYEECRDAGRCDVKDAGDGGDVTPLPCGDGGVDYPDLMGLDNDCDGIDGDADAGYFVDPVSGKDDTYDGTRDKPFQTLRRALQEIRSGGTGRSIVYLSTGTYNEPEPMVDMPVSLYGGYSWRGNKYWDRFKADAGTTHIISSPSGFLVHDVTAQDARVLLDAVHITSADATNDGEASIALRVRNTRELVLSGVILEAGRGAPGASGEEGSRGMDGGSGGPGSNADSGITTGGNGGTTLCTSGYAGGRGGIGGSNGSGNAGSPGKPLTTGGGASGAGGSVDACEKTLCLCTGGDGGTGATGNAGDAGTDGYPGQGFGRILADTTWEATQEGGEGTQGTPGQGGGGGGGGGNCSELNDPNVKNPLGGGGGGGGSGGCGGAGGKGGKGGGASIGLLATDSQLTVERILKLIVRGGGQGGDGGSGGPGGRGGTGGAGGERLVVSSFSEPNTYTIASGNGGMGGNGGAGGPGGFGGGGGGGPSVGAWCVNTVISREHAFSAEIAPGGQGGVGNVDAGATGLSQENLDCTLVEIPSP